MSENEVKQTPEEWFCTMLVGSKDELWVLSKNQQFIDQTFWKEKFKVVRKSDHDSLLAKNKELEDRIDELTRHIPKVPTEPYEKRLAKEVIELRAALSEEFLREVIDDWQMFWMNQTINPEDTANYRSRALGVDANMKGGLARMISEKALQAEVKV